jgi:hypothetical protein
MGGHDADGDAASQSGVVGAWLASPGGREHLRVTLPGPGAAGAVARRCARRQKRPSCEVRPAEAEGPELGGRSAPAEGCSTVPRRPRGRRSRAGGEHPRCGHATWPERRPAG